MQGYDARLLKYISSKTYFRKPLILQDSQILPYSENGKIANLSIRMQHSQILMTMNNQTLKINRLQKYFLGLYRK